MLTTGSWILASYTLDSTGDGKPDRDLLVGTPPCHRDDRTTFLPDGTIRYESGSLKCTPGEPDSLSGGKWLLGTQNYNLRTLTFETGGFYNPSYYVQEISSNAVVLTDTARLANGSPARVFTTIYKH